LDFYSELLVEPGPRAQAFSALIRESNMDNSTLKALEMAIERRFERLGSCGGILAVISEELRGVLAAELETESSESDLIGLFEGLTRQLRAVLSEISQPEITQTLLMLWQIAVLTLDKALKLAESRFNCLLTEKQERLAAEEAKLARIHKVQVAKLQEKLGQSAAEAGKQAAKLERLKGENERLAALLRDREDEIRALRRPGNVKEWERMLDEMARYFEEAEGRQETQANLLESISKMLDTSKVKSLHPRTHRSSISSHWHFPVRRSSILPSPRRPRPSEQAFFRMMTSERNSTELPAPVYEEISQAVLERESLSSSEESCELQEAATQTDLTGADTANMRSFAQLQAAALPEALNIDPTPPVPMPVQAVIELLEQTMQEKVQLDILREGRNEAFCPFSEVFVSLLYTQLDLPSAVSATLKSFLAGLDQFEDPDRLIYSQLLGVREQKVFPSEVEAFLAKAWVAAGRKEAISLLEGVEIVGGMMKSMGESAGNVLENCVLNDVSAEAAVYFLISRKLSKLGRDFKYFFTLMDSEKCGKVTFSAFCETNKRLFGFALSSNMLNRFWSSLHTEKLTYSQLISQPISPLDIKVQRIRLLQAIISEYERLKALEWERLQQLFASVDSVSAVSLQCFTSLVRKVAPSVSGYAAIALFRRVLGRSRQAELRKDRVCAGTVAETVMESRLGEVGKLGFAGTWQQLEPAVRRLIEAACSMQKCIIRC